MADLLQAALWLAERGMHVFPLDHPSLPTCAGVHPPGVGAEACTDRGKHPVGRWGQQASTDPQAVAAEFAGRARNIGVACGPSRLLVVDEDVPGGFARFAESKGQAVPDTFTVTTGKGSHFYFRAPADRMLGNAPGEFRGYGCDIRGGPTPSSKFGGYVVAPGSLHVSGVEYRPVDPAAEIRPCPGWLAAALDPRPVPGTGQPEPAGDAFDSPEGKGWWRHGTVAAGSRHDALIAAAGWCRDRALTRDEAAPVMQGVFSRLAPGKYTWDQALGTLADAYARWEDGPTRALRREMDEQRLRRQARRLLDAEDRPPAAMPPILTLRERLAQPRPEVAWRIDGWQPAGSRVMLAAQFKAGKTTLVGNLVRSLVDGNPFLGQHTVTPVVGTVAVLDFEMSPAQLDGWLADQKIAGDDRVVVLPMRGSAAAFDILDPARRAEWARMLADRGAAYLVLDCLRPVLDTLGLDEQREAGRFLVALDALLAEAGIPDAAVVHHMGHQAERSRGDSRIRDWPDVEWRLVRQDDEPGSARYLSAYGRDVDQPESALGFDPATRHLTLTGGSRKYAAARAALGDVLAQLDAEPGASGNRVELALAESTDHPQKAIREALKLGVRDGVITKKQGKGRAFAYYRTLTIVNPEGEGSSVRQGSSRRTNEQASAFVDASIGTQHARTHVGEESSSFVGDAVLGPECAVPDCTRERRRGCRTCSEHMTEEMSYQ